MSRTLTTFTDGVDRATPTVTYEELEPQGPLRSVPGVRVRKPSHVLLRDGWHRNGEWVTQWVEVAAQFPCEGGPYSCYRLVDYGVDPGELAAELWRTFGRRPRPPERSVRPRCNSAS